MWYQAPYKRVGGIRVGNGEVAHISGVNMSTQLGDQDRRAVDLLLDRSAGPADGSATASMYAAPSQDGFEKRMKSVEDLLRLLDWMPVDDPPLDLMNRTMARIEQGDFQQQTPTLRNFPHLQPKPHSPQ